MPAPVPAPVPIPDSLPVIKTEPTDGNYIINGNFDLPKLLTQYEVVKNLPGWSSTQIERGVGNVYNANWGNTMVVELDGNHNDIDW